jgi:signal transduction histidine kinase
MAISYFTPKDGPEAKERTKRIELDFLDGDYVIRDTGPGVLPVDHDAIFESGFSRKPDGSGLGLFITRSVLERGGYKFTLDPYEPGRGATFRIGIPEDALPSETPA